MAITLKPVDAVMVGFGWTGAIMSQQLCDAGLNVLGLERGPWRDTSTEFATGFAQDELRYMWRHHLFQNVSDDTLTIRNNVNQEALPMRHLGSFLLGTGVGSGGVHWNGQIWRFLPSDFKTKSHNQERYGKNAVTDYDLTVQDWGVTYDELELHYDAFDKLCGTSGKAGNLRGQIQLGGNPFEGPRSDEYPTPPMKQTYGPTLFGQAAASLGRHPFPHPTGNLSQSYVNPLGCQLGKCTYCGFCEKFGCGNYSKASPQTTVLPYLMRKSNFELRTECEVLRIELTPDKKRATGVTYVNSAGEEFFQPAEMVFLGAYILHNVRLLLLSGIGQPYDPALPPALDHLRAVPAPHLLAKAVLVHCTHGQHDMSMGFEHAVFGHVPMHIDIGDHAPVHEFAPDEVAGECDALCLRHLARKGEFDLAGKLRVLPDLERLHIVPEPFAIALCLWRVLRQHHLGMDDAALGGKILITAEPLVAQP